MHACPSDVVFMYVCVWNALYVQGTNTRIHTIKWPKRVHPENSFPSFFIAVYQCCLTELFFSAPPIFTSSNYMQTLYNVRYVNIGKCVWTTGVSVHICMLQHVYMLLTRQTRAFFFNSNQHNFFHICRLFLTPNRSISVYICMRNCMRV